MRQYTISNIIAFRALYLALPAGAKVYWNQGNAGAVLLLPGVHYLVIGSGATQQFVLGPNVAVSAGDIIAVG